MSTTLKKYLQDPFLRKMYSAIRKAGSLRSISVDITPDCNLRCTGCYYFAEKMDRIESPLNDDAFERFVENEKARGTNFVTVVGGEPSLVLNRLKIIYDNFWMNVATNGIIKIPYKGFENMPIGVSVWGNRQTDKHLRGSDKIDTFYLALKNYRDDPRAFWYYTVTPGNVDEIEDVVEQCVENDNCVLFNFYGDLTGLGGELHLKSDFAAARDEIIRMIARYPGKILMTAYLCQVVSTGELYDQKWGYDVCTSITYDHIVNRKRIRNGKPYNPHFRAYNADFQTTRRCCTGITRDCTTCFDVWEHFSWVMLNMKKYLGSKEEFTNWLTTMYMFYLINRIINFEEGVKLITQIQNPNLKIPNPKLQNPTAQPQYSELELVN